MFFVLLFVVLQCFLCLTQSLPNDPPAVLGRPADNYSPEFAPKFDDALQKEICQTEGHTYTKREQTTLTVMVHSSTTSSISTSMSASGPSAQTSVYSELSSLNSTTAKPSASNSSVSDLSSLSPSSSEPSSSSYITPQSPVTSQGYITSQDYLSSQDYITSESSATSQIPMTSQGPITSQSPTTSQSLITSESPTTSESSATSQIPMTSQGPITSQSPTTSQSLITSESPTTSESLFTSESLTTSQSPTTSLGLITSQSVITSQSFLGYSSMPASTTENNSSSPANTTSLETQLSTSEVQSVTSSGSFTPSTAGSVISTLESAGHTSAQPYNPSVVTTTSGSISLITTGADAISTTTSVAPSVATSSNIFVAMSRDRPPNNINVTTTHPVARLGINQTEPLQTNKFYANFFLGGRGSSTWTHPYSVSWLKGVVLFNWGISVVHIERSQVAYGPGTPAAYFLNPLGILSLIFSATGLGNETVLTMDSLEAFSVNVNLAPNASAAPIVTFPLVQGTGFVTAKYTLAQPIISSTVTFVNLTYGGVVAGHSPTVSYTTVLNDAHTWLIYITPDAGEIVPVLTLFNSTTILANATSFSGIIQVTKRPDGVSGQNAFDRSAGVYPIAATLSGTANKANGSYTLAWTKAGQTDRTLLMYALPHHVASFSAATKKQVVTNKKLQLETTTKGRATAVYADSWTMVENNLPYDMDFAPWSPITGSRTVVPDAAVALINSTATSELSEDMIAQTNLNSMYYAGKGLAKFAFIVWAANAMGNNTGLASAGLVKLEKAFSRFVNNTQIYPLIYEDCWGGVVSSATYQTADAGADFGNTYYNDHHFHYGYFVYAAAVIAYLDPAWLTEGTNKAWVDTLIRDYANPTDTDPYFPFSRMFDWYHGHSWAHGLYETGDGKDQESSSEDGMASYGIKMWGYVNGDPNMEARGNLMLAVQARSFSNYYLYTKNNVVEPPSFIGNKAAGILFENKIDHTTYFGNEISYIEGIHMIPLNPSSALTRSYEFVNQEWNTYFSNNRSATVAQGGWRGIVMANLALIQPKASYRFFANQTSAGWTPDWLDGGASRTWYLAFAAGLGGADTETKILHFGD